MSETNVFQRSHAVIADIHGNRWALEAVLQDIERRGIRQMKMRPGQQPIMGALIGPDG